MSAARPEEGSEIALLNGVVHRIPGDPQPAAAIGIRAGRVLRVGSNDEVREALSGAGATVIDLAGHCILPAFIESHTHFHRGAVLQHLYLDFEELRPARVADVLDAVGRRASDRPAGDWIQGDGLSNMRLAEQRLPNRRELDAVAPRNPVLLRGIGKHVVAANSLALAAAGIDAATPDPAGGRIERDDAGQPTGILHERAKLRLDTSASDTVVPSPSREDRLAAVRAGVDQLHRLGIGTIHEMVRMPQEADDLAALHAADDLGVKARLYYRVHESPISLDWLEQLGIRRGLGDDRLRIVGVKVSVDGFCIFGNAAVYEPYLDQPQNCGIMRIEPDRLNDLVRRANAQGLNVAIHAVGPRAADLALDAFEAAGPMRAGPHRLEHAYLDMTEERLHRIARLGLAWSTQPGFLSSYTREWAALFAPQRIRGFMPLGRATELGVPLLLNSDFPCSPADPLTGIRAAVEQRTGPDGRPVETISLAQAWRSFTCEPGRTINEPQAGRLEEGSPADLISLHRDPFAPDAELGDTTVCATLVDGAFVYDREGFHA